MNNQRHLFDLDPDHIYLNAAYMSPLLKASVQSGIEGLRLKTNPQHIQAEDFFTPVAKLKALFSKLIDSPNPHSVSIGPAASYAVENVARNIPWEKGDHILLIEDLFPSNIYPWMAVAEKHDIKLNFIPCPHEINHRGKEWNNHLIERINERTKVISIPIVHWSEGIIFNIKEIVKRAAEINAYVVIDGTQSIGALPFSVTDIPVDALICASYKWLLGPYGFCLSYFSERLHQGRPIENNWINRKNSEDFSNLTRYQKDFQPGAARFSMGEHSNFIAIPMLQKSINQIIDWSPRSIQKYCSKITQPVEKLKENGYKVIGQEARCSHLFSIYPPGHIKASVLLNRLRSEDIYVSQRGASLRISPHVYNTLSDIDRLVNSLLSVVRN